MQPVVTDGVSWSVGLSATIMSRAKNAELIEVAFGVWIPVGPRKHVMDGGPNHPCTGALLTRKRRGGL